MTISRLTILRLALLSGVAFLMGGCATPPTDPDALAAYKEANDPLEPFNRAMFDFNLKADKYVIRPLAEGYVAVIPERGRKSIRNALDNLHSPIIFANDLLQLEITRALTTLARMVFNSTIGIGGLFDVVGDSGLPYHDEDFGQTLAVWGVGEGPYLVLPLLGPSNPRDAIGLGVDGYGDPFDRYMTNTHRWYEPLARGALDGVDKRAAVLDALDQIQRTSLDFYATIRSLYRQRRIDEINNGEQPEGRPGRSIISGKEPPAPVADHDAAPLDDVADKSQL